MNVYDIYRCNHCKLQVMVSAVAGEKTPVPQCCGEPMMLQKPNTVDAAREKHVPVIEAAENGTLEEAWGTGTAAVISPIGQLTYKGKDYTLSNGQIGELSQKLYDQRTGIQWGKVEDKKGWSVKVCNA